MKFDNQVSNLSLIAVSTIFVVKVLTSFSFVWPWNCGSLIKTDKIDPVETIKSSYKISLAFLKPLSSAKFLIPFVIANLKPVSCVPPSGV